MVDSLGVLKSSRSVACKKFSNFEMLDAKIASVLNKIIQNSNFKKQVSFEEQKVQKEDRFLRGRHIAFMIYDYFRVTGAHNIVLDYADLFSITLRECNVQEFETRLDEILLSMTKIPSDDILENLYKLKKCGSPQLKTVLELYDREIHHEILMPYCQKLKTMVKRTFDEKLRLHNFDIRLRKSKQGAVVKSHIGFIDVERGKEICYQWKDMEQCSKGDQCSFRHESNDRAKPTLIGVPPSESTKFKNTRQKWVEKKKCQRWKSLWEIQWIAVKTVLETYFHQITLWVLTSSRKCTTVEFVYHRTVSRQILQRFQGRAQEYRNQFDEYDSHRTALRQANIREKEGPSLVKIQVKIPHQRSPYAMKFEDRSPEETARQERCAREDAWELARNIYKFKKEDKTTFYTTFWRVDFAGRIHNKPQGKKVSGGFRSKQIHGQQERHEQSRIGNREDIENPIMVVTVNGEVQTKEVATIYVRELDLFVPVMLHGNSSTVLSLGKLCEEFGTVTIGTAVRNRISSKMARNFITTRQIMYHSSYLVSQRVPLPHPLLLHLHRKKLIPTRKFQQQEEVKVRARNY